MADVEKDTVTEEVAETAVPSAVTEEHPKSDDVADAVNKLTDKIDALIATLTPPAVEESAEETLPDLPGHDGVVKDSTPASVPWTHRGGKR